MELQKLKVFPQLTTTVCHIGFPRGTLTSYRTSAGYLQFIIVGVFSVCSVLDVHARIRAVLEGMQHERLDVRLHACRNLVQLLRDYQTEVRQFVLGSEQVDPIIDELIGAVSTATTNLCQAYGEHCFCLFAFCLSKSLESVCKKAASSFRACQ